MIKLREQLRCDVCDGDSFILNKKLNDNHYIVRCEDCLEAIASINIYSLNAPQGQEEEVSQIDKF